jgi:signal peptidase I
MFTAMQMTNPEATRADASSPLPATIARKPTSALARQIFHLVAFIVLVVASYLAISHFLLQTVKVVGRSMRPTLYDSQRCLLNRWIYRVRAPQRDDIVVLRDPSDNGFSVKRVIGTPGDSIYMKEGSVYLNGCKLSEPYLAPHTPTFANWGTKDQLILCGKDQYYVLGDNRQNSVDSRTYGPVPRRNLLGPLMR